MFQYPLNYITPTQYYHQGYAIDFGWWKEQYKGQNIYAVARGYVFKVEKQKKGGNVIYIEHENKYVSCYAHLDKVVVKQGQNVLQGEKIGTMGSTGEGVTGMHLHFAMFTSRSKIYKNSDIKVFDILRVYPNQVVNVKSKYYKYFKFLDNNEWKKGSYELLKSKAIRTSCKITESNIVKVKQCRDDVKPHLTSTNPEAKAMYKEHTILNITETYIDSETRVWGKLRNCYVVLCNKDGTPQARYLGE